MTGNPPGSASEHADERGISPVIGIALLVALLMLLVAVSTPLLFGFSDQLNDPAPMFVQEGNVNIEIANGTISNQSLELEHVGGNEVPVDDLEIQVDTGTNTISRRAQRTGDLADGSWSGGERIQLNLNTSDVCSDSDSLEVRLIHHSDDRSSIVSATQVPITRGGFTIQDGSVVPITDYTATATVVGTGLTYGESGPNIPISLTIAIEPSTYQPWPGNVNDPNNPRSHTFTDQPAGAPISVAATREAFDPLDEQVRWSNGSATWVKVLRDGETPPNIQGFGGQASLTSYVAPYVDADGDIDLAENEAIYLFELGTTSTGSAADYQDVVVLVELQTQADTVGTYTTTSGETGLVCPTE